MGYYTAHELEIISGDHHSIIEQLRQECENARFALDEDGNTQESCKWYECDEEMKEFSKKYPDAIFVMSGEGEEAGDLWKTYYKNGKMQHCEAVITYEHFDETKLV